MKNSSSKSHSRLLPQVLLIIIFISSLVTGCHLPGQKSSEIPTSAPMAETPITEEISTAEPRKDLPPALVEVSPQPNSQIGLQQPISLYFNQPMDKESVEAAIHFEPRTSGRFSWEKDQILTFVPDSALTASSSLRVVVNTSAQAANKKNLQEPIEVDFQTVDHLEVSYIVPGDESIDVDPESVIFVTFNQPVAALGAEAKAEPAFSLFPQVQGEGYWLNTATYIFKPDPSMAGDTVYTIQLNDALKAASDVGLDPSQELEFSFTTSRPQVLNIFPVSDKKLSLDGPIEVQFNVRMDTASVEEKFSLIGPDEEVVEGTFEWEEDKRAFVFTPDENLKRNSVYTIRVDSGAETYGGIPLALSSQTFRTTYPNFNVDPRTYPGFEPYSNQYGVFDIQFTTPIEPKTFRSKISVSPDVSSAAYYLTDGAHSLRVSGFFLPETQYTITIDGELEDVWGARLGDPLTFTFDTPPAEPALSILTGQTLYNLVFVPASESVVVLQATNVNAVNFDLSPITVSDLITLVHPENYDYRQVFLPEFLERTTQTLDLPRNKSQAVRIPLTYQGNSLSPGIYFLGVSSPEIQVENSDYAQRLLLIVGDTNLVMKVGIEQAMIWATRLDDYSPLSGAPVKFYTTEGDVIAEGQTDDDGLFSSEFARLEDYYPTYFCVVGEPGQENFGFSISSWTPSSSYYELGINYSYSPPVLNSYIYTDRPLYRPGDTVFFKAAIFSRENGIPIRSDLESVTLSVYSDYGPSGLPEKLYAKELTLSAYGTIADSVQLPENATTGMYRIELSKGEEVFDSYYFDVATYRKPDIDLVVAVDQDNLLPDENMKVNIQADYYFGVPASDQSFQWSVFYDPIDFQLPGYRVGPINTNWLMPQIPGYMSPLGTFITSGEGTTNDDGYAQVVLTPGDLAHEEQIEGSTQTITLEVALKDESGFTVSQRNSTLVHPETFYIGVKPESYSGRVNFPADFSILTVDWDKQPVGEIPLEAIFELVEWKYVETQNPESPYRYEPQTTLIDSANPVTDDEGQVRVSFTPPDPGTYQLTLRSGDAITQVMIWVTGEGSALWPRQLQNQITLTADAENYEPGQTAKVFFPNPFPDGAKALVSIERGSVMETRVLDVTGAGYLLAIPLDEKSAPNIFISVTLLGEEDGYPNFRHGILDLSVTPTTKTLNVNLTLDPTDTEPGETVSALLTITDSQGNPVKGEFSIAVVDKSLLALVAPKSESILKAFYGKQPLSVQTSLSLKTFATQLTLQPFAYGLGGGGGDSVQPLGLREDFPDTAFWIADVITGADGTAKLSIPMPDSLTTWVVNVRGLTEDYLVGQTEAEILTHKALMIRPVTPRFLVDGDIVEMAAVVHNDTPETLDVEVSLQGSGFTLHNPAQQTQTVTIEAGGQSRVDWLGRVESVETVSLIFQAVSGDLSDASTPLWGDLQVKRYVMPFTFSTAGQLTEAGERLELVSLPISVDPSSGSLMLELTPSLATMLVDGLQALETNQYGATISILSALLANLSAYQTLNTLGIDLPQLEANLAELVDEEILALLNAQNYDGGWSWFPGGNLDTTISDVFTTTYVLLGLTQALQAELEVPQHFIDRAVEFLTNNLVDPGTIDRVSQLDQLAFQVYALRDSGVFLEKYVDGLYTRRDELSPWALAMLGLSLQSIEGRMTRVNSVLTDLEAKAVRSATSVYWESERTTWSLPGSPIFNTSLGILALAQLDPASTSLAPAVRYLLAHRAVDGLWSSTFESAWALMAITEALQGTGDYQAAFDFSASLNERLIAVGIADGTSPLTAVTTSTAMDVLYPDAPNALLIERGAGSGTLYYRVDLQTYRPAGTARAINQGIGLERKYYLAGEGCPGAVGCTPVDWLQLDPDDPTQVLTVAVTVVAPHDMYHFMLEDFIPSGTEILNPELLTSQTVIEESPSNYDPIQPFKDGWGWWYFNDPQIYDDHILWVADFLPAGTYTLTYEILPTQRGAYQVLPAHAWQYFYPEVQGTSAGDLFTIE